MFGIDDAAVAGFAGATLTNFMNKDIASSNNEWSAAQYASRYQTQVDDLKKAGLNPMLAYGQSPGSSPTAQQVQFQNPTSSAAEAYGKASEAELRSAQLGSVKADIELKKAQADAAEGQARATNAQASEAALRMVTGNDLTRAQTANTYSQIAINKANLPKIAQEIVTGGAQAGFYRAAARNAIANSAITEQDFYRALNEAEMQRSSYGKIRPYARDAIGAIGGIKGAIPRSSGTRETGTYYDQHGNPTGGYSRQRN